MKNYQIPILINHDNHRTLNHLNKLELSYINLKTTFLLSPFFKNRPNMELKINSGQNKCKIIFGFFGFYN
jgi:hypothetical protein